MRKFSYLLIPLLGISTVACTTIEPTAKKIDGADLSIGQDRSVQVSKVSVTREDGMITVRGDARFPSSVAFGIFRGHIDVNVDIPGEKGFTLHNVKLNRRRLPRKHGRTAYFVAHIPMQSQPGMSILPQSEIGIRAQYTEATHMAENQN